jgi:hypothetical protein
MMTATNSQSSESVQTNSAVILPAIVDALDAPGCEPPSLDEWSRALRAVATAFLRQVSGENNCVVEARLIAAHKLIRTWQGTAH